MIEKMDIIVASDVIYEIEQVDLLIKTVINIMHGF
jgi:predicted nicotinamide N-methyase